jgi:hypothetical protein
MPPQLSIAVPHETDKVSEAAIVIWFTAIERSDIVSHLTRPIVEQTEKMLPGQWLRSVSTTR